MNSTRRQRGNRAIQCPFKVGEHIRATAMFEHHNYLPDAIYQVTRIDPIDQTLRARDETGHTGGWIRWQDCETCDHIGWEWLKGQLSAEALNLLAAFDGLSALRLRPDIRLALVDAIPALKERIVAIQTEEENHPTPLRLPQ